MAMIVVAILSIGASSGFWAWMMKRTSRRDAMAELVLGLAHNEIIRAEMAFLERGWITKDEFEDFDKYLWKPYTEFGGNGLAERLYHDILKLPIYSTPIPLGKAPSQEMKEV